jgi:UDP-N-acetylmuramyl tripeptide synthase
MVSGVEPVVVNEAAPGYRAQLAGLLEGWAQPARDREVRDLEMDSRRVTPGTAFLACRGRTRGNRPCRGSRRAGAVAVL